LFVRLPGEGSVGNVLQCRFRLKHRARGLDETLTLYGQDGIKYELFQAAW
jgi:hypothetical protein